MLRKRSVKIVTIYCLLAAAIVGCVLILVFSNFSDKPAYASEVDDILSRSFVDDRIDLELLAQNLELSGFRHSHTAEATNDRFQAESVWTRSQEEQLQRLWVIPAEQGKLRLISYILHNGGIREFTTLEYLHTRSESLVPTP